MERWRFWGMDSEGKKLTKKGPSDVKRNVCDFWCFGVSNIYIYIYLVPPPQNLHFLILYWYLQCFLHFWGPFFWHFLMILEVVFINVYKHRGSWIQDPRFWEKLLGSKVWIQGPRSKIPGKTSWIQGLDPRSKIPGNLPKLFNIHTSFRLSSYQPNSALP